MLIAAPDFYDPNYCLQKAQLMLDQPGEANASGWTGKRTAVSDPWHCKWRAHYDLEPVTGDTPIRKVRAFLVRARGILSTFRVPAIERAQNSDAGVTLAADAAANARSLTLAGYTTSLLDGQFLTVNEQLLMADGDQDGDAVAIWPPLRVDAVAGASVETAKPYLLASMTSSANGWSIEGVAYGISFDVEEEIAPDSALILEDGSGTLALE